MKIIYNHINGNLKNPKNKTKPLFRKYFRKIEIKVLKDRLKISAI